MKNIGSAPGKIILTGEYAVVFGFRGIAIPSPLKMEVEFEENRSIEGIEVEWEGIKGDETAFAQPSLSELWPAGKATAVQGWNSNLIEILNSIQQFKGKIFNGKLTIKNSIPLGKGMGSSTSLVIAVARCMLGGECRSEALAIENKLSPNNSGIDFNVIWEGCPILFKKDEKHQLIDIPKDFLSDAILIDTGTPNESTKELVAWVTDRRGRSGRSLSSDNVYEALEMIGNCTERLINNDDFSKIIADNYRAQLTLGIVPPQVQELIEEIEQAGGAAKVMGAGGRTGGGGMVLALHKNLKNIEEIAAQYHLQSLTLN
ncbi:hypothetical protein KJ652_03025 [Patescibacteria group bacterium]|nr:hypothetical protein [Patescibacteria group bacterium]MBU1123540.1 hypothetical protein [Patescibacteria group bacterium]MBU1911563.1 hypothetical protein [Patescibacteria group bacterium]